MPDFQQAMVMGRLTKDPVLKRVGAEDTPVCNFTVAINSYKKGGEKKVHFQPVTAWGTQAENCAKYLSKGDPVFAVGELETSKWKDDDGREHSMTKVIARKVQFLRSKTASEGGEPPEPGSNMDQVEQQMKGDGEDDVPF